MTINDVDISHIYEFMEQGNPKNAPQYIVDYLELLDKVRGMIVRIDLYGSKDVVIKHLMTVEKLSRYKASQVYDETVEYFYCSHRVSKAAWKNIYADKMDKMINFAMLQVRTVDDARKVVQMIKDIGEMREVHVEDKSDLAEELFQAPVVVYSLDPEDLGLPKANRQKLAEIIDKLPELTEKEKTRIKQEAMALPLEVFPNEQTDPRKS